MGAVFMVMTLAVMPHYPKLLFKRSPRRRRLCYRRMGDNLAELLAIVPIPSVDMDNGIGNVSVPCAIASPSWSAQKWVEDRTSWLAIGGCWWDVVPISHAPFQGLVHRLNSAHTDFRWLV